MIRRRLFRIASALSLLLCAVTVLLLMRSYWWEDQWELVRFYPSASAVPREQVRWQIMCGEGHLWLSRDYFSVKTFLAAALTFESPGLTHRQYREPDARYGWRDDSPYEHWFRFSGSLREVELDIPLIAVTGITALLPTVCVIGAIKSRQHKLHGRCPACGYSLTGNTSGICPECGSVIPTTSPAGPPRTGTSSRPISDRS